MTQTDQQMMSRAIALAKRGRYTTAPNPMVGCVIVNNGEIVGEGYHYQAGQPHAEVFALRQAQQRAQGATVYVTLEPCSHHGRTPPCAEALINAKVARVVCAMVDPNPVVAGRGIALLQAAGIRVDVGVLALEAQALNPGFIKQMTHQMPYVELKLAASLDGRTALANGESKWITGPKARSDVQQFRACAGAILSTSATVIADNPSLNVRWSELDASVQQQYPQSALRQPIRVIIDSQNRLTPEYQLFNLPGETILARTMLGTEAWPDSVQQWQIPTQINSNQLDLVALMSRLATYGINHIWVEAGASLAGALLQQQLVDSLILYQAPKLMGSDSRGLIDITGLTSMTQTPLLAITDVGVIGDDIRIMATVNKNK
ncbi:bifunctional diaminohydroxyphosphoribosylaminopyrimidine deaminase/5-amino-6-(5-phosphoribosylamino)uracil reductase RibD [Photobacterium iliopiscarium]|uniref:bifunctional diaminohydroxyphosphoribosylaminopyrimidine deaminase/5-amino-6-(5-phosphoribosylamino)uracil reductase RibD n=1 Tax=Photobacterium iliopiscarium TaxID=56192 RepID=UPI001E49FFE1|nr:bifunctional diaminohydroxyphosphoribosylaminopyrimidine deaminase/5-amino-6-(5-phosphoribosylamino)uracil reductase RibD [Photobacterium iliopiscarium]MCD9468393.1 riboflavin biosynthesis protein RibD [Photobacterium iliopiscarium]MCD9488356.1 bifunctional diaminohydroxyphosphoribosylaminopyrimidine deaminase/5-amino-6-(5-phosphoribosylamino)uracil reductase RibD [Photobacterium iliopiscarium]MCF2245119.1 bifunctional diaminohydroxyphosphoribosylaminopyrimidine deaminase/5-amino-6-(5-phospho